MTTDTVPAALAAAPAAQTSEWTSPSFRPEHINQIISGVDRYNPQNLAVLNEYLQQQLDEGTYDCLANLAILKLFQFNPADFDYGVAVSILAKALTAAPRTDFSLCLALLGEAPVDVLSAKPEEGEGAAAESTDTGADPTPADAASGTDKSKDASSASATQSSAGLITDALIVKLAKLNSLLQSAKFREFWAALANPENEDVAGVLQGLTRFDDAIRAVALYNVKGAFRAISPERLASYLNLRGSELSNFISKQPGWVLEGGKVIVPANVDNDIKATVIREDLQLDQLTKFLSQAQAA
ncbi:ARM repeat-containing protein [Ceraceosorus guamensis]|uniref:Eukaryotic translation initiation factor 3 subunit K n=1 Tax=Ceraceosorus guamensis TaxID=1522189 RepID=A0A316WBV6_9BASI|nr:ARM repeat-containing protein [Ceraceosorus guamensis]PWN45055.1 ARM repeat-containing protein [Ceraceosorus guamensis]